MTEQLIFLRRTQKEREIFGGEVYIDINGRNIALLTDVDLFYGAEPGEYSIKMYKSHTFDSYIGHAETLIKLSKNEKLLIKYSPPMIVNQPGTIVVSTLESTAQLDNIALQKEEKIKSDDSLMRQKRIEQEEKTNNGYIILIVIMVISAIIYGVWMVSIFSY